MILKVNNINVFYGKAIALSGLSLEIKRGELIAVIGSNGVGKTTLVNTISGLIHPKKGTIEFKGERIDNLPAHEILKRGIVQIPEGRKLFGKLSVNENLLAGAYLLKSNEKIKQLLEETYRMFPILKKRKNQFADTLSGGEQQMLAIGRGLMSDGELIIFDEPSLGLMPIFVKQVAETIKEMHVRGYTILLIEQNVQEALKLADRAYVIQNGNNILSGASKDLLKNDLIKKAYLGL